MMQAMRSTAPLARASTISLLLQLLHVSLALAAPSPSATPAQAPQKPEAEWPLRWPKPPTAEELAEMPPHIREARLAENKNPIAKWMLERARRARAGAHELVRLPLVLHSSGWGCRCPDFSVGYDPTSSDGDVWIDPDFEPSQSYPPNPGHKGSVVEAEGYFSGTQSTFDGSFGGGTDGPYFYPWQFTVLRFRPLPHKPESDEPPLAGLQIILSTAEAAQKVEALKDERPWLVIVGDVPRQEPKSLERAESLKQRLRTRGISQAEVLDSRQAPLLFCCFHIVIAGRYPTSAKAKTAMASPQLRGLSPYIRKGW